MREPRLALGKPLSPGAHSNFVASIAPKRRKRGIGLFLILLAIGAFAYLIFAAVARFFLGDAGFFLVTIVVVALLLPPYAHVHRQRKRLRAHAVLYRPLPEKVPGHAPSTRLEAEILASFILGASAIIMLVVGYAARVTSAYGDYSNFGLYLAGLVLTWVAMAVIKAWFFTQWTGYDPYDPDGTVLP